MKEDNIIRKILQRQEVVVDRYQKLRHEVGMLQDEIWSIQRELLEHSLLPEFGNSLLKEESQKQGTPESLGRSQARGSTDILELNESYRIDTHNNSLVEQVYSPTAQPSNRVQHHLSEQPISSMGVAHSQKEYSTTYHQTQPRNPGARREHQNARVMAQEISNSSSFRNLPQHIEASLVYLWNSSEVGSSIDKIVEQCTSYLHEQNHRYTSYHIGSDPEGGNVKCVLFLPSSNSSSYGLLFPRLYQKTYDLGAAGWFDMSGSIIKNLAQPAIVEVKEQDLRTFTQRGKNSRTDWLSVQDCINILRIIQPGKTSE